MLSLPHNGYRDTGKLVFLYSYYNSSYLDIKAWLCHWIIYNTETRNIFAPIIIHSSSSVNPVFKYQRYFINKSLYGV